MASLLFLLPLVLLWVLFVRPQQRRMRQAQAMVATLEIGDEIITSGGIYGTVTDTDDTTLWVEIAPDVVVRLLRGAVAQRESAGDIDDDVHEDDEAGDDSDVVMPGSNGLSASVPNTATPSSPTPDFPPARPTPGDDEA